jgi:hypothetical protein
MDALTLFHLVERDKPKDAAAAATIASVEKNKNPQKSITRARRMRKTSIDAYKTLGPGASTQAAKILELIIRSGAHGVTDDEGEAELGIRVQSYTARRNGLAKIGLIRDSGGTRLTPAGRAAIVWIANTAASVERGGNKTVGGCYV